jgi:hypothetical protein
MQLPIEQALPPRADLHRSASGSSRVSAAYRSELHPRIHPLTAAPLFGKALRPCSANARPESGAWTCTKRLRIEPRGARPEPRCPGRFHNLNNLQCVCSQQQGLRPIISGGRLRRQSRAIFFGGKSHVFWRKHGILTQKTIYPKKHIFFDENIVFFAKKHVFLAPKVPWPNGSAMARPGRLRFIGPVGSTFSSRPQTLAVRHSAKVTRERSSKNSSLGIRPDPKVGPSGILLENGRAVGLFPGLRLAPYKKKLWFFFWVFKSRPKSRQPPIWVLSGCRL